jgi:hypothetical protein
LGAPGKTLWSTSQRWQTKISTAIACSISSQRRSTPGAQSWLQYSKCIERKKTDTHRTHRHIDTLWQCLTASNLPSWPRNSCSCCRCS